mgnify:CR=1 FL=1
MPSGDHAQAAAETFRDALRALIAGRRLEAGEAERVFTHLLSGELDEAQMGALLARCPPTGVASEELIGAARAMRAHVTRVPYEPTPGASLIDTCGTGGAPKAFNVSTAAAIVAASVEPPTGRPRAVVAKHGNRSRTGRGSAEVLEMLGVRVDASPETQGDCLREVGVCFSFAIHHHPAMRHAAGVRRSLGVPTIFNCLGPLTNPAGARRQLIGVFDPSLVEPMARALAGLGAEHALVVHGDDGLDELTITTRTTAARVREGVVSIETIDPGSLGLEMATFESLCVGSVDEAADAVREVLDGRPGARRSMTLLNAAAALTVAETASDLIEGLRLAAHAVDSGRAHETLQKLGERSRG